MASAKDLRKRITSVKNTQQTTKAMKMVSAAKLRRAQEAILNHRPYAKKLAHLLQSLVDTSGIGLISESRFFRVPTHSSSTSTSDSSGEFALVDDKVENHLLVVVSSDRGLCGGFNSNIIKMTQRKIMKESALPGVSTSTSEAGLATGSGGATSKSVSGTAGKGNMAGLGSQLRCKTTLAFIGRKGFDFFKTKKVHLGQNFLEAGGRVTFLKAKKVSDVLVAQYLSGEWDSIKFIYNEFKNAASQNCIIEDFLPLPAASLDLNFGSLVKSSSSSTQSSGSGSVHNSGAGIGTASGSSFVSEHHRNQEQVSEMKILKPGLGPLLELFLEKNFAVQVFRILLESQASEHGARMGAMENATRNAGEMIRKLTLQYNKQRQAGITKELLEIISGSESQKASA